MSSADAVPHAPLVDYSVRLISDLQTPQGAYPASPHFSAYRGYCWFRDGAFIADAMSAVGEADSAARFFAWCAAVIDARAEAIAQIVANAATDQPTAGHDMLPTRFTFDGADGADAWWDFQLDGYGTWLWALGQHLERHGGDASAYASAVTLTVRYLVSSWQRPCFDWWEEHEEQVHASTLGCVAAGLREALAMGVLADADTARAAKALEDVMTLLMDEFVVDGHLVKWRGSPRVDASLASLVAPLAIIDADSPVARGTLEAIAADLDANGGIHRYRGDTYFGGGQWPLLSCFAGIAWLRIGNRDRATRYAQWAASTAANGAGDMPEQVTDHLLDPSQLQPWINKWGSSANPLLWSHAMFIRLAKELHQ